MFQFTRPRGGAIFHNKYLFLWCSFNSHAPVGARFPLSTTSMITLVSIHTPPWGRDFSANSLTTLSVFQFTRPRGGAIVDDLPAQLKLLVSIHTPPWGRDQTPAEHERAIRFQFTRPRGGAISRFILFVSEIRFQFTRPRGGAIKFRTCDLCPFCFNSHAPVGAR